jgi:hypothetical protein
MVLGQIGVFNPPKVVKDTSSAYFSALDKSELPLRHGHHVQPSDGIALDGRQLVAAEQFDFDEIDRRLGTMDPESGRDRAFRQAGDLLEALCVWLAQSATVHSAGLRGLALAWMLRPRAFGDRSTSAIAKRMGTTTQSITKYVSELHRLSHGIFTGPQMHTPETRQQRREICTAYHKRVGHAVGEEQRKARASARARAEYWAKKQKAPPVTTPDGARLRGKKLTTA